ncbi:MAG TPA: Holliday junction resolvase RuvX [Candidatus Polarisedimenticolia bacterium]
MALDVGEATVGVAVSDPLGITAQPITTVRRRGLKHDLRTLADLAARHEVGTIVVGLPLRMSGVAGSRASDAETFAHRVREALGLPVVTWDERLSTVQAERCLLEADLSRRRRREVINHVAAAIILQAYLDSRPRTRP